jgi:ABC-2 type transport system permease protein
VNWQHFRAFLWLRWRLLVNQVTRGGILNKIILAVMASGLVVGSIGLFVGSFLAGVFGLPAVPQEHRSITLLLVWDGLIFFFLMSWCIGLMAEMQRTEAFSLQKFLHLPVSLSSAFALNYLSSLACLTMVLNVPTMIGLSLGLILGMGPLLAVQLPVAAAFLFMVTALTYQFQGWLSSLMVNKRRRRTIIVVVTLVFILMFQVPNLVNLFNPWTGKNSERGDERTKQRAELERSLAAKEITQKEFDAQLQKTQQDNKDRDQQTLERLKDWAWIANMALPILWPAWGAAAATEGNVLPGLFGTLALTLIGTASLWRAYKTTMRLYTGQFTAGTKPPAPPPSAAPAPAKPLGPHAPILLEKAIPGISEQAAIIALAGFRGLLRAPEVKMLLLSPIIMVVVFGGLMMRGGMDILEGFRPLLAYGAIAMMLFTMGQLAGNQFGFDRSGFRIFVLSPAPRREILLGKNLSILPVVFGLTLPLIVMLQIVHPMRWDHLLSVPFQFVSMFLIYCMLANVISMLAPMPVATGSLKPVSPKTWPMLLHMLFVFVVPTALAPTLVPLGIEAALEAFDWSFGMPICLVLTALECAAIIGLYRVVITWEGRLLQAREQKILEIVVTKAE